jgi:Zn-finger nucleic acid-binding protein
MQCPKCGTAMREREKGDVIIDICPNCHGVWLDADELEKLEVREQRYYDDDDDDDYDRRGDRGYGREREYGRDREPEYQRSGGDRYGRPQKKKGFLSNMFESFGEGGGGDD